MKLYKNTTIEKATIEARHFKEKNDDPFWLEPYELPTEEEIIEIVKHYEDLGVFGPLRESPRRLFALAIIESLKGER